MISMKKLSLLVCIVFSFWLNGYAQCPEGDVTFYDQADVEEFLSTYPNCTSIQGDLVINNFNNQEPMDLTGLSQLQQVEDDLGIVWVGHYDSDLGINVPGLLNGLENITSVGSLFISSGFSFAPSPIESLQPLNGIGGQLGRFILNDVQINEELPDFENITSLVNLSMNNVQVSGSTPQFPSLTALSNLVVQSSPSAMSTFSTLYIPDNLVAIEAYPLLGVESSLTSIAGNDNLEEIVGGSSLWKIDNANIANNSNLIDLAGFAGVTQVKSLAMQGCHPEFFDSFKALSDAGSISLDVNNFDGCSQFHEEFKVRIGEDSEELRVLREGYKLRVNDIDTLEVTSPLSTVGGLEIFTSSVSHLYGFSTLDSIVQEYPFNSGELKFLIGGLHALPDFAELKYIAADLKLDFLQNTDEIQNLEGLEALEYVRDEIRILDYYGASGLESLDGLDNLEYAQEIAITGFPVLSDISILEDIDTLLVFELFTLPALNQELTFTDMTYLPYCEISATGLQSMPHFPQVTTVGSLIVLNHDNLTVVDGFSAATSINSLVLSNNSQLQNLDFSEDVVVNSVDWQDNPQFESCAESPLICHILSMVDPLQITLENNGVGCNDLEEILAQCTLSSSDGLDLQFSIRMDDREQLLITSPISGNTRLRVYDSSGKVLHNENRALTEGENYVVISSMSTGIYLVELIYDDLPTVQKVFVGGVR